MRRSRKHTVGAGSPMPNLSEHGWTRKAIEEKLAECRKALDRIELAAHTQRENIKTLERELTTLPS